jgi:hypothetical protein
LELPLSAGQHEERRGLETFVAGLLRPSGASLVGMILFALAETLAALWIFTPRHMAVLPPVILMNNGRDDYARITFLAYRLEYEARPRLSVVYLGPSTAQRALFDSLEPAPIEAFLRARVGEDVDFYSLYAAGETVEESAILAHHLPDHFRGVVVMVVLAEKDDERSRRLALQQNADLDERLPLDRGGFGDSARIGLAGKRLRRKTGVYFLDHLQFFTARRATLLHPWRTWTPLPRGGTSLGTPPMPGSEERSYETRFKANPLPLIRHELDLLAEVVDSSRAHGAEVVLVESPANPRYRALKGDANVEYDEKIRAFAAEHGAEYWDLNPEVRPRRQDFEDAVHLGAPAARLRFQRVLCRHLARKLRTIAGEAEGPDEAPDDDEE